jgi:hypothetical protein
MTPDDGLTPEQRAAIDAEVDDYIKRRGPFEPPVVTLSPRPLPAATNAEEQEGDEHAADFAARHLKHRRPPS